MAIWVPGQQVPVDRLLTNAIEDLRQHPDDAAREYLVGRLYSLKFSQQKTARVVSGKLADSGDPPRTAPGPLVPEDVKDAEESIAHYRRAVELDPKSALDHFSLAWMMQEYSRHSNEHAALVDQALPEYRLAYHLALQEDLKQSYHFSALLSEQAGTAVVSILKTRKPDPAIQTEIAEVSRNVKILHDKPLAITPVIFAPHPGARLEELTSSTTRVRFDIDGFDDHRTWTWLQPTTCILVWDPQHTGRIASGRQLFGSVTWWMFWRDGFEPLAALDDNRDGKLTAAEISGIAVWRDANGNGVSDPGEVIPAEQFGIAEIAVRGGGITLRDGTVLPMFDWVPQGTHERPYDPDANSSAASPGGCSGATDSNRWPRSTTTATANSPASRSSKSRSTAEESPCAMEWFYRCSIGSRKASTNAWTKG
jgi:hypothetical protein